MPTKLPQFPFKALELARQWGYLYDAEVCALYALAASLPPESVVVNIGAGAGTSALCFAEAGQRLKIVTVDIEEEHSGGGLLTERRAFAAVGRTPPMQILGNSQTLPWDTPTAEVPVIGQPIFCVFIDGGHLRPEIEGDMDNWLPRVIPGGFAVFHDYESIHWPDVAKAVTARIEAGQLDPLLLDDSLIICRVCPKG